MELMVTSTLQAYIEHPYESDHTSYFLYRYLYNARENHEGTAA